VERSFQVFADWIELESPQLMGTLFETGKPGRSVLSFEYDEDWLRQPSAAYLDPDLQLFSGRQYPPQGKAFYGVFTDSAPDRWGRNLIRRREALQARAEKRKPARLTEIDYLIGVNDFARSGALRFREKRSKQFMAPGGEQAVPPWFRLRTLEEATRHFEEDESDESVDQWLKLLLAPGSSLGGARPKASVQGPDSRLWIAKFPSKNDAFDTGAWEMLVYNLAARCGLDTVESRMERFSPRGTTFLTRRFDRTDDGGRIHFASALTLLGKTDGVSAAEGSSYLELTEFIRRSGSRPKDDLYELWSRIVFNIAVSNTDDHMRNHGFLLEQHGWHLSQVYDINPDPEGYGLSLNISEDDNSLDFDLALSQAHHFYLTRDQAEKRLKEIVAEVQQWRIFAEELGISTSAITAMEPAFHIVEERRESKR
jgi:serine/threonine-protein kinase HipA